MAYNYFMRVVLLFYSATERDEFEKYVSAHLNQLESLLNKNPKACDISDLQGREKRVVQERLKIGEALNKMLLRWRILKK